MSIIAGVDFSALTNGVVSEARLLALRLKERLFLIHVVATDRDFIGMSVGSEPLKEQWAEAYREEHRKLQAMATNLGALGVEVTPMLVQGPIVDELLAHAARLKASHIVVGSHGHGAVAQLIVGSAAEGVIRRATCPVVVVPVGATEVNGAK